TKPSHPIPGTGFAGMVEEVGEGVDGFEKGQRVFGETGVNFGANAEYLCLPEDALVMTIPSNLTEEEAAPICDGALTSYNFLKAIGNIQSGQKVLINGASGSLGSAAVQLAHHFGAEVTGVCGPSNLDWVRSLGADTVIDYSREDFTRTGQTYDLIYDTVGKSSYPNCKGALSEKGAYLSPVLSMPLLFQMLWTSKFGSKKAKFSATGLKPVPELRILLQELLEIFEAGKIKTEIDRRYPLDQAAEAHRHIDTGHKRGNVVLVME
ncbi:MAG: NAD(P)-dependent alcohol dehydrogenase, partial [Candidatus Omnitrophica bacterium]|nr:NAD(P)-dependent alcohol dehydrogenase [Candidatus Omnitrophota bacterium]